MKIKRKISQKLANIDILHCDAEGKQMLKLVVTASIMMSSYMAITKGSHQHALCLLGGN